MFLEFIRDEADGQPGGVDRHVEFFEQVRQAADVVLVSVGDEQALDAVLVLQHVGEIRDDQIDAEHIRIREDEAAIDQDHIALALIQGNVFADFTQTAQRADVHGDGRGHLVVGGIVILLGLAAAALLVRSLTLPLRCVAGAARARCRHGLCRGLGSFGSGRAGRTAAGLIGRGAILLRGLILMILARGAARRTGLVGARIVVIFTLRLEFFHENLRFSSSRTDVYRSVHADISCACLRFMYFC